MIYIRTCAYNAEKTLKRAVDSVLQQTYQDFEYHILDNGSTDRTGEIIRAYAKQDKRIVPYFSKVNRAYHENPNFWNLSRHIPSNSYFCILDADDAYAPAFFQEMLAFMETNRLEMAACGTIFLDGATGKAVGRRVLKDSVVVQDAQAMNKYFPLIHWNLRQAWGKLYSSRAAAARYEEELPDWYPKAYGGDTVNVLQCVYAVKQFGVYAKALHYYTASVKSVSHQWIPKREEADLVLHEKTVEFLQKYCGTVSPRNLLFLYAVYFKAVFNTLVVLLNSALPLEDKLFYLKKILAYDVTKQMLAADMVRLGISHENKEELLEIIFQWLAAQANSYAQEHAPLLAGVYTLLNPDFERLVPGDTILWYLREAPQTVTALVRKDYPAALMALSETLAKSCTQIFPVVLAQTLAALLQDEETYIFYSKLILEMQFQAGMYEQVESGLNEWEKLLPGDADLAELRRMLPQRDMEDF